MIACLSLYKLRPEVTADDFEDMMAKTRVQLLRISEVLTVKTGKRVNADDDWPWFIYLEAESMDKLAIAQDDPNYIKFREEVVKPNVAEQQTIAYEMEPRKDVRYS